MDFEKCCMVFTIQEPYYGILLSSMERVPTTKLDTLAVARYGNVFRLYYNPEFCGRFSLDTVLQLIRHELLHVALQHFTIWDGEDKDDTASIHRLRNIACDLEVNSYLDRGRMQKEAGGCWAEDFGMEKCLGAREYFRLLGDMMKRKQQERQRQDAGPDPKKPCNGGGGGHGNPDREDRSGQDTGQKPTVSGADKGTPKNNQQEEAREDSVDIIMPGNDSPFDEHGMWPDVGGAEAEELKAAVDDILVQAADEVEKSCGSVPEELADRIKLVRDRRRPKPVADWRRYFRRFVGNEFSDEIRRSRKRPSKRFPDAAGSRHQRKANVLVAIDTSGSICMKDYKEFMGQLRILSEKASFHIVECDAAIHREYDFDGRIPEEVHGGGGTSFQPPVDMFRRERGKYEALVYFTDGCARIPADTPKETIWVISSDGDQSDRKRYRVNGASVVFIPKKKEE